MKGFTLFALCILTVSIVAQDLPRAAKDVQPLMNGENVPDAQLTNLEGEKVSLLKLLSAKPAMIIFYRGSWCPYCNRQLAGLQEVEPQIRDLGFQILAISPDKVEGMRETVAENQLSYNVFSDSDLDFTKRMGLAFIDRKDRKLPVPAVYLVDRTGLIQFNYVNPNYKVRPEPELLLKAAELMVRSE